MKAYVVGGAVRDELLGHTAHDRDWVVVGARPQDMIAAGYRAVGRDFPVFLHPTSSEQYALARTERKSGPGYHGFQFHAAPDVTLEQDLARRDLTINAMALDPDSGTVIDPFNGQADLRERVLRHVSPAFVEDPVRALRIARFCARWPDFSIAPETLSLLRQLVDAGEIDALVPERVWQELSRGLMERRPSRMWIVLRECAALARLAPELEAVFAQDADSPGSATGSRGEPLLQLLQVLDHCADRAAPLPVRYACLCHDLDREAAADPALPARRTLALSARWRVDSACQALALLAVREQHPIQRGSQLDAAACLALIERCDALRRPERFDELLLACECIAAVRGGVADRPYPPREHLLRALAAARLVNARSLATSESNPMPTGVALGQAIHQARVQAIAEAFARA